MLVKHKDYLSYELPDHWCIEEDGENLLIYNPDGNGAITISFLSILESQKSIDEYISIITKRFVDQNRITLHSPLILYGNGDTKTTIYGTGKTLDDWFFKIWVVAKHPKIVFATYLCEKRTSEVKECDAIINSMCFSL